jgi:aryl-alcohol dehydrogenase-like predicted oxidoreductase
LTVSRTGFGVLPLQRTAMEEAVRILRRAYEGGITLFDTAHAYSDSEEKIGRALGDVRAEVVIATKSMASTRAGVLSDLTASLRDLRTDYVDIFQLHNPASLPDLADAESAYAGALEARARGMARCIGITNHRLGVAVAAVESGLFETLQFPLSHLAGAEELAIIDLCRERNVGLIGMKSLAGGLLTHARPAFAFLRQFPNLVPIWGFQRMAELEEMLALDAAPPALDASVLAEVEHDRRELAGNFCRACGYCLPCPADIPIPMAARMGLLLRRMPYETFLTPAWRAQMQRITGCSGCNHCRMHCPYGLDTPELLKRMLGEYEAFFAAHGGAGEH